MGILVDLHLLPVFLTAYIRLVFFMCEVAVENVCFEHGQTELEGSPTLLN